MRRLALCIGAGEMDTIRRITMLGLPPRRYIDQLRGLEAERAAAQQRLEAQSQQFRQYQGLKAQELGLLEERIVRLITGGAKEAPELVAEAAAAIRRCVGGGMGSHCGVFVQVIAAGAKLKLRGADLTFPLPSLGACSTWTLPHCWGWQRAGRERAGARGFPPTEEAVGPEPPVAGQEARRQSDGGQWPTAVAWPPVGGGSSKGAATPRTMVPMRL